MKNKWYWVFKNILVGPALHVYNRPTIEGREKIPTTGGLILASSHQSVMDSFFLALLCPRQITYLAKNEYFTAPGAVGKFQKWFFSSVGQIPLDRDAADARTALLTAARKVILGGDVLGIYPEGTRSPDGRVYRGKTGMAMIALDTGAPVIPVAVLGARKANPIGSWLLRPAKVGLRIGDPIDPIEFVKSRGLEPNSPEAARELTDYVMHTLASLTGEEYVDVYAHGVKKSLEKGEGYPPGVRPPT